MFDQSDEKGAETNEASNADDDDEPDWVKEFDTKKKESKKADLQFHADSKRKTLEEKLRAVREKKTKIIEKEAKRQKMFYSKKSTKEDEDLLDDLDENLTEKLLNDLTDDFFGEKHDENVKETKIFYASRTVSLFLLIFCRI